MKALLLQFAGPGRLRQLGRLTKIPVAWHVAEPRWPHFRDELEASRPDFIVLDLSRHPTHGFDAAQYLQRTEPYATIPLYAINPTEAVARKLGDRLPTVPVVTLETLIDRYSRN